MGFLICLILSIIITVLVAKCCYDSMKPVSNATEAVNYMDKEINLSIKSDNFVKTVKKKKDDN